MLNQNKANWTLLVPLLAVVFVICWEVLVEPFVLQHDEGFAYTMLEITMIAFVSLSALYAVGRAHREYNKAVNTIFALCPDLIGSGTLDGHFTEVNPAFEAVLGYTPKEFLSHSFLYYVHEDDIGYTREILDREVADGDVLYIENRYLCKDGSYRWIEWNSMAFPGKGQFYTIGRDITNRKEMETKLQKNNALMLETEQVANLGSYILDIETGLWESTAILDQIFGINDQVFNKTLDGWLQIIHPVQRDEMKLYFIDDVIGREIPFDKEYRIVRPNDNAVRWIHGLGKLIYDNDGALDKMIGTIHDITDQKLIQLELIEAKLKAEAATFEKDKYVSLIAHDLNSPFTSIVGFMRLILNDKSVRLKGEMKEKFEAVILQSEYTITTIDKILHAARFSMGRFKINSRFIDGHNLAFFLKANYGDMAREKGITIVNDVPEDARLYGDEVFISEVLQNLVTNAIKFCSAGDRITIFIPEGEPSTIAVKDSGLGIEKKMLDGLFRFDVKDTRMGTAGETGSGLGLPFCREIMEAHNGSVDVESVAGEGSVFYVRLPDIKPRVIICDDDVIQRNMISIMCQNANVDITETCNGEECMKIVDQIKPDLILLNIYMPNMDGFDVLKKIKGNVGTKGIFVIVIASDSLIESREKVIRMGADDFISKPVMIEELIPRMKKFII